MISSKFFICLLIVQAIFIPFSSSTNSNLFREYIGSQWNNVKFTDVPINPNVEFHFILSFAIDYTDSDYPSPTNGKFNAFWDTDNLTPGQVSSIKRKHSNVKVALSIGGDSVGDQKAVFNPTSINSWVRNAVSSLTTIIQLYHLDGIDIDYEHFNAGSDIFAECIGRLLMTLKRNGVISFASIAPYDDEPVQSMYLALWNKYGEYIDYVNYQFYGYVKGTTVSQFLEYYQTATENFEGATILTSFMSAETSGLSPEDGFFTACRELKRQGKLNGIFIWCADDSMQNGFSYEKTAQAMLASQMEINLI
ncbi:hypothetical protein ACHQM5_021665 [Ranunculus cassubicifolius]